jgi:CheY-like chemotaxis protein
MDGDIWVESKYDEGSKFTFFVLQKTATHHHHVPALPGDEADDEITVQINNARMLVVDDIEINLIIAKETLSHYGGVVELANSGAKAIEMIKGNEYDLVFMDHMMPELDGVDVTRIVRALPEDKYKKLPIIALTANVVGDVRAMFIASGMNDFLSKPLEHREIMRVLREWLPTGKWEPAGKS